MKSLFKRDNEALGEKKNRKRNVRRRRKGRLLGHNEIKENKGEGFSFGERKVGAKKINAIVGFSTSEMQR